MMMNGFFDDLINLPKALTSAKNTALGPVKAGATAAGKLTTAIESFNSGAVERKIDKAVDTAEVYLAAQLGLQAIATFAAVGMLIVHINATNKRSGARYFPRSRPKAFSSRKGVRR